MTLATLESTTGVGSDQTGEIKIGFVIPEFPAQTHIFFWRELQALARRHIACELISTRLPMARIMSHAWSAEARSHTYYLIPPGAGDVFGCIVELLRSGPAGWLRCLKAVMLADQMSTSGRLKLLAMIPIGAMLAGRARARRLQHIHVHSCASSADIALFARLLSGITYSLTLHGPLGDYGPNQRQKWRNAAFAIVITRQLARDVREQEPGAANLPPIVAVAGMGVDAHRMSRSRPYEPYQPGGQCRIFTCGRLNACKGHDDLIRAVGLLRTRGLDARLQVAGDIDSPTSTHRAYLEELIKELNLKDAVELLGAVSEERVRTCLEEAQVFSLASWREPLGVAIMEAMAMEVPVVVTNAGGVTELVEDRVEGLLVPPRSPDALAFAIEQVIHDPQQSTTMGQAGRRRIKQSFHSEISAETIERCLATIKPTT